MTNIRKQITVNRPTNEEEFSDQIGLMGDKHREESLKSHRDAVKAEIEGMRLKYEKEHQNDAYMKDVLVAADIAKHFPSENHEDRWQRQHKLALELDAVNDELRNYGQGSEQYDQLMAKRLALESLL